MSRVEKQPVEVATSPWNSGGGNLGVWSHLLTSTCSCRCNILGHPHFSLSVSGKVDGNNITDLLKLSILCGLVVVTGYGGVLTQVQMSCLLICFFYVNKKSEKN